MRAFQRSLGHARASATAAAGHVSPCHTPRAAAAFVPTAAGGSIGAPHVRGHPHLAGGTRGYAAGGVVPDGSRNAFGYCVSTVKRFDYEHYLCAAALPKGMRPAAFALRAFNVETVQVFEQAREAQLAHMRLQWWRGAIDSAFKGPPQGHPVVEALHEVLKGARLTRRWFSKVIDAREQDVQMEGPPRSLDDLERYAENTASALLYLQLEAAGVRDHGADHAASHVGKAAGLVAVLRGTGHHARARRTYLPQDLLTKHKVSQESVLRGEVTEGLKDVVLEVASAAKAHLDHARQLEGVPDEAKGVLLPAAPAGLYLEALEKADFDPLAMERAKPPPLWVQGSVAWHAYKGTF